MNIEEDKNKKNVIYLEISLMKLKYDVCLGTTEYLLVHFTSTKPCSSTPKALHSLSYKHEKPLQRVVWEC